MSRRAGEGRVPVVEVTRVVEFAAAHRLHSPFLSPEANRATYGKCNNPNGHGHTYRLEATVAGPLDPAVGRLAAAARLDRALADVVLARFDGAHLNRDVPELADTSGTSEQLAELLHRLLAQAIGPGLRRVVLHETPNNVFQATTSDGGAPEGADGVIRVGHDAAASGEASGRGRPRVSPAGCGRRRE